MTNTEMQAVKISKNNSVVKNYQNIKHKYDLENGRLDYVGDNGSRSSRLPSGMEMNLDVAGMEYHIEMIQKAITNLKEASNSIHSLIGECNGLDWKTLNKEAYSELLNKEVDYFMSVSELLDKFNAHINYTFRKIVETDNQLKQYLSN